MSMLRNKAESVKNVSNVDKECAKMHTELLPMEVKEKHLVPTPLFRLIKFWHVGQTWALILRYDP